MDRHHRRTHLHHQRVRRDPQDTVVVYKTLTPTFRGPIAGYSTVGVDKPKNNPTPTPKPTRVEKPPKVVPTPTPRVTPTQKVTPEQEQEQDEATPTPANPNSTAAANDEDLESDSTNGDKDSEGADSDLLSATSAFSSFSTPAATRTGTATLDAFSTSKSTSTALPDSTGGATSSGGTNTVGVIGGVVGGLLALLCIAAFFYRRRKQKIMNQAYGKAEDEKRATMSPPMGAAAAFGANSPFGASSASIAEKAPRVSLRPVTQFNPVLMNPPAASPVVKTGPSGGSQEIARKPIPAPLAIKTPANDNNAPAAAAGPKMPAAMPSPTLSAFSDGVPGTPVDAAALVANGQPAPVYRVQMDYVPSQPDELGIQVGDLVRMLHEYDDGWALCVRMNRTQQGVCPRTCLSARPVKPRPNPAPGSPGAQNQQRRGPPRSPPQQQQRGPESPRQQQQQQQQRGPGPFQGPQQDRPQSPAGMNRPPYPHGPGSRPQTPTQQRPMTPRTPVPQITVSEADQGPPQGQGQGGQPVGYAM